MKPAPEYLQINDSPCDEYDWRQDAPRCEFCHAAIDEDKGCFDADCLADRTPKFVTLAECIESDNHRHLCDGARRCEGCGVGTLENVVQGDSTQDEAVCAEIDEVLALPDLSLRLQEGERLRQVERLTHQRPNKDSC